MIFLIYFGLSINFRSDRRWAVSIQDAMSQLPQYTATPFIPSHILTLVYSYRKHKKDTRIYLSQRYSLLRLARECQLSGIRWSWHESEHARDPLSRSEITQCNVYTLRELIANDTIKLIIFIVFIVSR